MFDKLRPSRPQYVVAKVQAVRMPPPERQFIDHRKWKYSVNVQVDALLLNPDIDALNQLLLATEGDLLLIGVDFVSVKTDTPERYDAYELASAVCKAFNVVLSSYLELKPDP